MNFINLKKSTHPVFLLLAIAAFHLFNNFIVIELNSAPFIYNANRYYYNAVSLFYHSKIDIYRPPLLSFLSLPLFGAFGVSQRIAAFGVGGVSFLALIAATYLLGKNAYSRGAGLLGAFILSCSPIIFGHSRTLMSDLLLGAWVTFAILLLSRPQALESLKYAILIGLVSGLGMLTAVSYPVYIIGPFAYVIFKNKAELNKKIFLNIAIILLISFYICSFWYLPNFNLAMREYIRIDQFGLKGSLILSTLYGIAEYGYEMFGKGMFLICWPLFAAIFIKKNKHGLSPFALFCVWICTPLLPLSILAFKNTRFIIPLLPAIAVTSSILVLNIEKSVYKKLTILAILLIGLAQTLLISYSPLGGRIYSPAAAYSEWDYERYGLVRPWREDWPFKQIYDSISRLQPRKVAFIKVRGVIVDSVYDLMQKDNCGFEIFLSYFNLCCLNKEREKLSKKDMLLLRFLQADAVVKVKNPTGWYCDNENELEKIFQQNINRFKLTGTIPLPDNSELEIYKKADKV